MFVEGKEAVCKVGSFSSGLITESFGEQKMSAIAVEAGWIYLS